MELGAEVAVLHGGIECVVTVVGQQHWHLDAEKRNARHPPARAGTADLKKPLAGAEVKGAHECVILRKGLA